MKIIKPCNFRRIPRLRLSEARRGSAVRANILTDTNPLMGGALLGAAGFIANS
jgi:hypothetical protein